MLRVMARRVASAVPVLTLIVAACGFLPRRGQEPVPTVVSMPVPTVAQAEATTYVVRPGDTLSAIAFRLGTTVEELMRANGLTNPDAIFAGQELKVASQVVGTGPAERVVPDAAVPRGPHTVGFDVNRFVADQGGALSRYAEQVDGRSIPGSRIVERIAVEYSVSPKVLLAFVEARSGWVTGPGNPSLADYPAGLVDPLRRGLWWQLTWLANQLNGGFYGQKTRGENRLVLAAGGTLSRHPDVNPGTFALQRALAAQATVAEFEPRIAEFEAAYRRLFGDPWVLEGGAQRGGFPRLELPFTKGETWWFTGGPHGGWVDGSAWSALDFVPPDDSRGCYVSRHSVVAVADGVVVDAGPGLLWLDLDGDGTQATGPAVLYLHVATTGRAAHGSRVRTGDPLGKPSCEGGSSSATHLHIARTVDGEWLPAGGDNPFVLGEWRAESAGRVYDGTLVNTDGRRRQACECWTAGVNDISW